MSKDEIMRFVQIQLYTLAYGILIFQFTACAKIGSPAGGPKDTKPPKVINTSPPENSINFTPRKKIVITFDEYIQLKDIFQELIISPPLEENPTAYIKNKDVVVEFPVSAVFDTTTYTLNFGKSISDNNEGNVLSNFEYVFSLKDYIDSMNVEGRVVNAFDYTADKDRMFVMLYENLSDSAPLKEKPAYICRSNEEGYFAIHNVKPGHYRLFALKDANSNYKYDLQDEQIAFSDSLVVLSPEKFKDSMLVENNNLTSIEKDFQSTKSDSLIKDSLQAKLRDYLLYTDMLYFSKQIKNQYLTNSLRNLPEQLIFTFNQPLEDTLQLKLLNTLSSRNWYILDANDQNDTLKYWMTDTTLIAKDSLQFELRYAVYDSTGSIKTSIDTIFLLKKAEQKQRGSQNRRNRDNIEEKEETKEKIKRLGLNNNANNSNTFDLNRNIEITSSTPTSMISAEKIKMFRMEDTSAIPIQFKVEHDTQSMYKYVITYKQEEQTQYRILIPDSTITDIYGTTNDTIIIRFTTQSEDFYGTGIVRLTNVKDPIIIQLLDEKEILINEKYLDQDQIIKFEYLYPKKYIVKLIIDSNRNEKWDTGDYLQKLQPEKVLYYPQIINVRSNWEVDYSWALEY